MLLLRAVRKELGREELAKGGIFPGPAELCDGNGKVKSFRHKVDSHQHWLALESA
jgi:hypothetical protein